MFISPVTGPSAYSRTIKEPGLRPADGSLNAVLREYNSLAHKHFSKLLEDIWSGDLVASHAPDVASPGPDNLVGLLERARACGLSKFQTVFAFCVLNEYPDFQSCGGIISFMERGERFQCNLMTMYHTLTKEEVLLCLRGVIKPDEIMHMTPILRNLGTDARLDIKERIDVWSDRVVGQIKDRLDELRKERPTESVETSDPDDYSKEDVDELFRAPDGRRADRLTHAFDKVRRFCRRTILKTLPPCCV